MAGELVYHVMRRTDWDDCFLDRRYEPRVLKEKGYIPAATLSQVLEVARKHYPGHKDLVLLCIDPAWVPGEIRYEDQSADGEPQPRIYSHFSFNAILSAYDLPISEDGSFSLPQALARK